MDVYQEFIADGFATGEQLNAIGTGSERI